MVSIIKIYKNTKILPVKNFKVDNIGLYLAGFGADETTITDFQFIKHALNLEIKIDASQRRIEMTNANNFNYCSIVNHNGQGTYEKTYYYFINKVEWRGESTILLSLTMDTINTFANDLTFTNKTKVLREHKDRYVYKKDESVDVITKEAKSSHAGGVDGHDNILLTPAEIDDYITSYSGNSCIVKMNSTTAYVRDSSLKITKSFVFDEIQFIRNDIYDQHEQLIGYVLDIFWCLGTSTNIVYEMECDTTSDEILPDFIYTGATSFDADVLYTGTQARNKFYTELVGYRYVVSSVRTGKFYGRNIDIYSEGITPVLYGTEKGELRRESDNDLDWYLVYKNADPNGVDKGKVYGYIYSNKSGTINFKNGSITGKEIFNNPIMEFHNAVLPTIYTDNKVKHAGMIEINALTLKDCYLILNIMNYNENITIPVKIDISGYKVVIIEATPKGKIVKKVKNNYFLLLDSSNNYLSWQDVFPEQYQILKSLDDNAKGIQFLSNKMFLIDILSQGVEMGSFEVLNINDYKYFKYSTQTWTQAGVITSSNAQLNSIDSLDRLDPLLIKIIKLPYCPASIEFDSDGNVSFDSTIIQYDNTEHTFKLLSSTDTKLISKISSDYNPLYELYLQEVQPNIETLNRTLDFFKYDSKLFNSDYYQPKLIYDSFAFTFKLECCEPFNYSVNHIYDIDARMEVEFKASNTINSRMAFSFPIYSPTRNVIEDYPNILTIARNNECLILNSDYISYIKGGYNYDVKSLERQKIGASVGLGASIVGSVASVVGTIASGGALAPLSIAMVGTTASTITSAVNTIAQGEANLEQKLHQSAMQSVGVIDSNDVDIMNYYTNNRAKWKLYEVSPRLKDALNDLFFYTGYVANYLAIPNTTSRKRFNFLSCEPVWTQENNIQLPILEDLRARYNLGVTYLHYNASASVKWDFEQVYENWESIFFN